MTLFFKKACAWGRVFALLVSLAVASYAPAPSFADETPVAGAFAEIFTKGKSSLNARYRYEWVDDEAFAENAKASTLRTRIGFRTARFFDFEGMGEIEDVRLIGNDNFNDTLNGNTSRPVVADLEGTEVNQLYLSFFGIPKTVVSYGRRTINLDNERFIGDVGWRQNNQTFDATTVVNTSVKDLTLWYGHISNVNRIFGEDSPVGDFRSNIHLFNAKYTISGIGSITPYAYLLDFDSQPSLSSSTYGARLDGKKALNADNTLIYDFEYSRQSEYEANPNDFSADYWNASTGLERFGFTFKGGCEVLGSDSGKLAFQTPLATLHKWNGWADKFLTTPANGLRDSYVSASYKVSRETSILHGLTGTLVYHDFSSDFGNDNYGNEWDFEITKPFLTSYVASLKFAHYNANSFSSDTDKIILTVQANFS